MVRIFALLAAMVMASPVAGQELSALARLDAASVDQTDTHLNIGLGLSQPVPWRIFSVDGPPRFVMDFKTVSVNPQLDLVAGLGESVAVGQSDDGWSRIVLRLPGPWAVEQAAMTTGADGSAELAVSMRPVTPEVFAASARPQPAVAVRAAPMTVKTRPVVVLDPGHGGIDPGAEVDGLNEKTLMLAFARELKEGLIRSGLFDVVLTRDGDEFVPLETRISRARAARADVFLSLHADELPEGAGDASGITVYTLAADASDEASRRLAERHNKNDLVEGVTLEAPGDEIALVLMDIVRRDTTPRSEALAVALQASFRAEELKLAGRPLRSAAFSVLKAPDIPSVLIELGFLSSETDRKRLTSAEWRADAVRAIETALVQWALMDQVRTSPMRQ